MNNVDDLVKGLRFGAVQSAMFRYAFTPRESMLQESALARLGRGHRRIAIGPFLDDDLPEPNNDRLAWTELEPLLNTMVKGRGQYWTGSPKLLTEALVSRRAVEGLVDFDKLTDLLLANGVFVKKTFLGFTYYVASKKKMRLNLNRLINKSKTRVKKAEKKVAPYDNNFQLNNPFEEN